MLKNGGYDTNTETARGFRDSLEFCVIVYRKISCLKDGCTY